MSSPDTPKLGNTTTDIVTSLVKGGIGMVPAVGSLIAEIVGNVIPNQRVDRISNCVGQVSGGGRIVLSDKGDDVFEVSQ